jgi:DNA-binding NarL/FixJ family response regulator
MEKIRVLIADDDDDMRKHMVGLLCRDFEIVGVVANDDDLFNTAAYLSPDVIVSEIFARRVDGLAARSKLIARGKLIPFVFVSHETQEIINVLRQESCVAFVYKSEMSVHLIEAVKAARNGESYESPFYFNFFDRQPEDQNLVLIDEETLRKAERMILSCEGCNPDAQISFDEILDQLTGSDPSVTDYILKQPGNCPKCDAAITEKTLVELDD